MRITASARKRDITDNDILHALRHHTRFYVMNEDDGAVDVMFIGPARSGDMLEVGVVEDDDDPRVIHAMHARPKFWP